MASNSRKNPKTGAVDWVEITYETKTVKVLSFLSTAANVYGIQLDEKPKPGSVVIDGYDEVTSNPLAGQFWVDYGNTGIVLFHADDVDDVVSVNYYGGGSPGNLESFAAIAQSLIDDEDIPGQVATEVAASAGFVPIGAILPWHKSFTNTPALPSGFVECNGQTLSDAGSVYNGQTIPNLNGDARFIRGGSTSGVEQADAMQGHRHGQTYNLWVNKNSGNNLGTGSSFADVDGGAILDPIADGVNGTPRVADETRPINITMVWIMRVK